MEFLFCRLWHVTDAKLRKLFEIKIAGGNEFYFLSSLQGLGLYVKSVPDDQGFPT